MISSFISLMEKGLIPDPLIRIGIRALSKKRLQQSCPTDIETRQDFLRRHLDALKRSDIAIETQKANEQHYEVPAEFFALALGQNRKYSACFWPEEDESVNSLDRAEEASLAQICARARLADGQRILELGCGWGSLSLWMAEKYPAARITGVSNSASQRTYIMLQAEQRGLKNLEIITCDINAFKPAEIFDRCVSIEMLEHVRNYQSLFARVASWLVPGGLFFVHVFAHREVPYFFEVAASDDWMTQHFFAGGQMPSKDLLLYFQGELRILDHWILNGDHYAKTAEAWLQNTDAHEVEILRLFADVYGADAMKWFQRWRVFFMSVAELFAFNKGEEWVVAHHLFEKVKST